MRSKPDETDSKMYLTRFISEGNNSFHAFSQSDRINFSEAESNAIYYGVMATLAKHSIALDSTNGIESATDKFFTNQNWSGHTSFRKECQ